MARYDDDDDERGEDSRLVKQLREEIKARDKALSERDAELTSLRQANTQRTIADVFGAKGVNPQYARWAVRDLDEVTEESVAQWIEENSALIGAPAAPQATPPQEDPQADPYRRMAAVEGMAAPTLPGDAAARVAAAQTEDEVWAALGGGRTLI